MPTAAVYAIVGWGAVITIVELVFAVRVSRLSKALRSAAPERGSGEEATNPAITTFARTGSRLLFAMAAVMAIGTIGLALTRNPFVWVIVGIGGSAVALLFAAIAAMTIRRYKRAHRFAVQAGAPTVADGR